MFKYIYLFMFSMSILSCKEGNKTETTAETDNADTTSIKISLAQWSFHKALMDKKMDNLDFATKAGSLGFDGVEYVNQFFKDKAQDTAYLAQMTQKAKEAGVEQLLIMVDGEGYLGDADEAKRTEAINNHHKWVDAAAFLGCHSSESMHMEKAPQKKLQSMPWTDCLNCLFTPPQKTSMCSWKIMVVILQMVHGWQVSWQQSTNPIVAPYLISETSVSKDKMAKCGILHV
jgi:hypothetical protein